MLDLWRGLQQDAADLPSPINTLIAQIARNAGGTVSSDATKELEKLYQGEVVAQCRVRVQGRYPFASGEEMTTDDFGDVFGYGGVYDKFFTSHLDKLVDTSQRPYTWRRESVTPPPGMLLQFERAERIRQMFFTTGSKSPEVGFMLRLSNLDAAASRFYVNIDGQQSEIRSGTAETMVPMTWPGQDKRGGRVVVTFEDKVAPAEAAHSFAGPWAWFRLIDVGRLAPDPAQPDTALNTTLRFQTKFHQVQATVVASNPARNPFGSTDWRQFTCEP
jgi:type VI secretion system protein ImpL